MTWRLALACCLLLAVPRAASANGRSPGTSTISFRQGHESDIAVGLTFGLLISHDAGVSWQWICEAAVGYQGLYDPHYAFTQSGALFATTFDGLKVQRDSCSFSTVAAGEAFASTAVLGPNPGPTQALYYAASQVADPVHNITGDFRIYKSTMDGTQFSPTTGQPAGQVSWWQSLMVAPSDGQRIYLSGYVFVSDGSGGTKKQHLMFRTINGGTSWQPLPITDLTLMPNSVIDIAGIRHNDPDHVYARVEYSDNVMSDAIYVSSNGGMNWTLIRTRNQSITGFIARANNDLVLGSVTMPAEISHDDGAHWTALPNAPHMSCLVESSAGELWACSQNFGVNNAPSDDAGIMKATNPDGSWTKVLRYQQLTDAVTCAAGTVQHDTCTTMWCAVCAQVGCTPSLSYACPVAATEAPTTTIPRPSSGCACSTPGGAGLLALGLPLGMLVLRRRRSPSRRRTT